MRKCVATHASITTGTLSCFDRLLFKGHRALGYRRSMEDFLQKRGSLFKHLKSFVLQQAERLKAHAQAGCSAQARPPITAAAGRCRG